MSANICCECKNREFGFTYIHNICKNGISTVSHIDKDIFSVFMLLDGEIDYMIEGERLHLKKNDILLIGNNELHRSIIKEGITCDYLLLMVDLDFFIKNNCTEFSDMVFNHSFGSGNLISAKTACENGIQNIFARLDNYAKETPVCFPVINSVIVELLYNINKNVVKSGNNIYTQEKIKKIIEYINENLTNHLTLDSIAAKFFLTKQYLCKIFKQNTGFTVNKYISYKRIVAVREMCSNGFSLSDACYRAGFNDYSAFYRAYSKIMNEPPRNGLLKHKKN